MGHVSISNRKQYAAHYFSKVKERRLLSLSHFHKQWLRVVHIIGCNPIVSNIPSDKFPGANYHFEFRFFSWATLHSVLTIVLSTLYYFYWFYKLVFAGGIEAIIDEYERHIIHGDRDTWGDMTFVNRSKLDTTTKLCLEVLSDFIPLSGFAYIATAFLSTPHLLVFLNGSNDFENRVRELFPGVVDTSLAQLNYFRKRIITINIAIFSTFILWHLPRVYDVIRLADNVLESEIVLAFVMVCLIALHGVLDDTKAVFILKTVEEYFQQILDGISNHYKENTGVTQVQQIRKWRSLVHFTRTQAKVAGTILQDTTNSTLFGMHLVLTGSTFLIYCFLNKDLSAIVGGCAYGSLAFFSMIYARLYIKALLAENITKKENELAEMIRLLGDRPVDTKFVTASAAFNDAQVEISFITDPIISKPTHCTLNRCVTLKVSLLLGIFRNVSTYAVALIQLDNVHQSLSSVISGTESN